MSDFVALYTAFSGLRAAQTAMDTASHNIANAANPAYTRQRVETATHLPAYRRLSYIGTGVDIVDITRARNAFLDDQYRASVGASGTFGTLGEMLAGIETALNEPDHGVTTGLGGLWTAFEELALDPTDGAARLDVLSNLEAVARKIRDVAASWDATAAIAATGIGDRVGEINHLLGEVAALNGEIASAASSGTTPNDLLDVRDLALDRLALLAGTKATITETGMARVSLNGLALVHDLEVSALSYDEGSQTILHASGATVTPGGEIAGLHGFLTSELPTMRGALDALASDLADALNSQHAAGFTPSGAAGGQLLSYVPGSAAATLQVVVADPADIAAAGSGPPVAEFDAENAEALAALRHGLVATGATRTLDEAARGLVTQTGQALAAARTSFASQVAMTDAAQASRTQAHGVSIDEEMVDLVTYQRAYEAAARVMTAIDESLDTLINRTGIVGR